MSSSFCRCRAWAPGAARGLSGRPQPPFCLEPLNTLRINRSHRGPPPVPPHASPAPLRCLWVSVPGVDPEVLSNDTGFDVRPGSTPVTDREKSSTPTSRRRRGRRCRGHPCWGLRVGGGWYMCVEGRPGRGRILGSDYTTRGRETETCTTGKCTVQGGGDTMGSSRPNLKRTPPDRGLVQFG